MLFSPRVGWIHGLEGLFFFTPTPSRGFCKSKPCLSVFAQLAGQASVGLAGCEATVCRGRGSRFAFPVLLAAVAGTAPGSLAWVHSCPQPGQFRAERAGFACPGKAWPVLKLDLCVRANAAGSCVTQSGKAENSETCFKIDRANAAAFSRFFSFMSTLLRARLPFLKLLLL